MFYSSVEVKCWSAAWYWHSLILLSLQSISRHPHAVQWISNTPLSNWCIFNKRGWFVWMFVCAWWTCSVFEAEKWLNTTILVGAVFSGRATSLQTFCAPPSFPCAVNVSDWSTLNDLKGRVWPLVLHGASAAFNSETYYGRGSFLSQWWWLWGFLSIPPKPWGAWSYRGAERIIKSDYVGIQFESWITSPVTWNISFFAETYLRCI